MASNRDHNTGAGRVATAQRRLAYRTALRKASRESLTVEDELARDLTDEADAYTRIREIVRELVAAVESANLGSAPSDERDDQALLDKLAGIDETMPRLAGGRTQFEGELIGEAGWRPPAGRRA